VDRTPFVLTPWVRRLLVVNGGVRWDRLLADLRFAARNLDAAAARGYLRACEAVGLPVRACERPPPSTSPRPSSSPAPPEQSDRTLI
jgi:hypothetical protein